MAKIYHKTHEGINKHLIRCLYYTTRNEFYFWMDNLPLSKKLIFFKKYLAKTIRKVANLNKNTAKENVDACLDGIYSAFLNIGGQWNKNVRIPKLIKKCILWHPYFWSDLIEFNFKKILVSFINYLKKA